MRTTAAAASVVTSAASLLPQPDLVDTFENRETYIEKDLDQEEHDFSSRNYEETLEDEDVIDTHLMDKTIETEINIMKNSPNNDSSLSFPPCEIENSPENNDDSICTSAGNVASMFQNAGFSTSPQTFDIAASTRRLAKELEEFVEKGLEGVLAAERGDPDAPSEETVAELQLQTARMLRQVRLNISIHEYFICVFLKFEYFIGKFSVEKPSFRILSLKTLSYVIFKYNST